MKIIQSKDYLFRRYISRFGKLAVARYSGGPIVIYPSVTGGSVGVTVSRQDAATGLKKWRSQT